MHKSIIIASLVLAAPLVTPMVAQQQQTISCRSNGAQQFCPANTSNGVRLAREQSNGVCQQGSTWRYDRRGITVSGGCSADFEVSSVNANGNGNGYGNNNSNGNNGNNQGNGNYNGSGGTNSGNNNGYNNGNRNRGVVIPAGTQLSVRIEQNVRPLEVSQNENIAGTLVNELSVNGNVVAPAGTPVQAQVDSVQGSTFNLRLTSMSLNGRVYTLATNSVHSLRDALNGGSDNQSAKRQFGSILGNIATGGQIPSGTVFNFRLTSAAQASGRGNNGNGFDNNR